MADIDYMGLKMGAAGYDAFKHYNDRLSDNHPSVYDNNGKGVMSEESVEDYKNRIGRETASNRAIQPGKAKE